MENRLSQWTRTLLKLDTMVTLRIESNPMVAEELNVVFMAKLKELGFFIISYSIRNLNTTHPYKYVDYMLAGRLELEEILFKFPNYMVSETQKMLGNDRGNTIQVQLVGYDPYQSSNFLYNTRLGFYKCSSILPESLSLWTRSLLKLETLIKVDVPINPQFVKSRNKIFLLFMDYIKRGGYNPIIVGSENWQGELEGKSSKPIWKCYIR